ncbi:MAG: cbb3-type cytochrome oxidase assembly protein CcoS [Pseudomonadota bacterium]
MSIIFLILPITLVMCGGAVAAFAWATRSGQFDDLETPAIRLLHDDSPLPERPRDIAATAPLAAIDSQRLSQ